MYGFVGTMFMAKYEPTHKILHNRHEERCILKFGCLKYL